ncbi:MAG TPA: ribonuclease D [Nevskiaceae bacterium]|nr:ribonuclease D [Nevskiaceae bacterium]
MSTPPPVPYQLIDQPEALAEQARAWATRPFLAVDTEFVRVDTYYPILCLVQVDDGERSCCIDMLKIGDAAPLFEVLAQPRILKVFHAAGQDLEILVQLTGACPAPMFDTQIAATLLGMGDQLGYAGLIQRMLGIEVDKSLSRTDWKRRPLTAPELAYAAADVRHLAEIYPSLHEQLAACGRLAWLAEDCARQSEPGQYRNDPRDAWRRLKGLARLGAQEQVVAAALAQWRENEAQARDWPRKWIVEDDAIYRVAQRLPASLAELEELRVLPPRTLARHGEALLEITRQARSAPPQVLSTRDGLDSAQKTLLQKLQDALRASADAAGLPASYIAPRADLTELVREGARAQVPLLQGWRRELAGEKLLALI